MGIFSKLFGGRDTGPSDGGSPGGVEHAVLLKLVYPTDETGMPAREHVEAMHALQDRLIEAIKGGDAGELDGDEFGEGVCTVYMYGASADRLWHAIAPVLETERFTEGSHAIKRFGEPGAREERIDLAWDG